MPTRGSLTSDSDNSDDAFVEAALVGDIAKVKKLFSVGRATAIDSDGSTILHHCCAHGQKSVAKWLWGRVESLELFSKANDGSMPIHWACINGQLTVAQWLDEETGGLDGKDYYVRATAHTQD